MLHKRGAVARCRHSDIVIPVFAVALIALAWSMLSTGARAPLGENRALVNTLGLSDLALMTEARYLRHPSQADLHSAFQDHPMSFDHFPGGSLIGPQRGGMPGGGMP